MRRLLCLVMVPAGALACAAPALAQVFEPVADINGLQVRLNGDDGMFHEQTWDIGVINEVHATVSMTRLGAHEYWAPVGRVALEAGDESLPEFLVVHIGHIVDTQLPLEIAVTHYLGEKELDRRIVGLVALGTTVNLSLNWDSCMRVNVDISGARIVIEMHNPIRKLSISASTGEFLADPFTAGTNDAYDMPECGLVS